MRKAIVLSLLIHVVNACSNYKVKDVDSDQLMVGMRVLPSQFTEQYYPNRTRYYYERESNREFLAYIRTSDSTESLIFNDLNKNEIIFQLPRELQITDYVIINLDSIVTLSPNRQFGYLGRNNSSFYKVVDTIPNYLEAYQLSSFYLYPLEVVDSIILVYNFPIQPLRSKSSLMKFFSTPRDTWIVRKRNKLQITRMSGIYPTESNEKYFYVYSPARTLGIREIIYSFEHSKTVYIYNSILDLYQSRELSCPDFQENQPFDTSRLFDYNYISQYLTESDRFGNMVYDKFRNQYYRILAYGIKFKNGDGTINLFIDKPFSILVYNDSLELKGMVRFQGRKYDFRKIYCFRRGVALITQPDRLKESREIRFFDLAM